MSAETSAQQLDLITRRMLDNWQQTKNYWKDSKSLEFEHVYLEELSTRVTAALRPMAEISAIMAKIRSECE